MKFGIRPEDLSSPRREPRGKIDKKDTQLLDAAAIRSVMEGRALNQQLMTGNKVRAILEKGK